jgi:histidinol-phosphate aminotransferase
MRLNPVLTKLTPYHAGPPVSELRSRYQLDRVARLSANESPFGPFPEVIDALHAALEDLNRYPDGGCTELRDAIAERLGLTRENLVVGNGSCELLMLLGEAFLGTELHAIFPHPSFVMYRSIAIAREAAYDAVELPGQEYDLEAFLAAIRENTSLIIVCNPNNPTGAYVEPRVLRAFLDRVPKDILVVLDEAYGEFATSPAYEDTSAWLDDYPNVMILRTFSKIYGLASMRVGYGIAQPEVIQALDKVRQPFNVNQLSQVAALEAFRRPEQMMERRRLLAGERERMAASLTALGVPHHPSEANFLLVDITQLGIPGPDVPQALLERGLMTRSGYAMGCPGWIRVTIGEVEENDFFLQAIEELRHPQSKPIEHPAAGLDAEALSPES